MYSYYEINVAKNGVHFFATAERSLTNETTTRAAMKVFREKFPESEGYSVTCNAHVRYSEEKCFND